MIGSMNYLVTTSLGLMNYLIITSLSSKIWHLDFSINFFQKEKV